MAAKKKAVRKTRHPAKTRKTARLWLMFPPKLITKPVSYTHLTLPTILLV